MVHIYTNLNFKCKLKRESPSEKCFPDFVDSVCSMKACSRK